MHVLVRLAAFASNCSGSCRSFRSCERWQPHLRQGKAEMNVNSTSTLWIQDRRGLYMASPPIVTNSRVAMW